MQGLFSTWGGDRGGGHWVFSGPAGCPRAGCQGNHHHPQRVVTFYLPLQES